MKPFLAEADASVTTAVITAVTGTLFHAKITIADSSFVFSPVSQRGEPFWFSSYRLKRSAVRPLMDVDTRIPLPVSRLSYGCC